MKIVYKRDTGFIVNYLADEIDTSYVDLTAYDVVEINTRPGNYYIDTSTKTLREIPPRPSIQHSFDYTTKTWVPNLQEIDRVAREQRNELLLYVDRVNPIWYASLTTQQQTELKQYRQALLDITKQSGYPQNINWPTSPSWLN